MAETKREAGTKPANQGVTDRRNFLKLAGVGAVASGATALIAGESTEAKASYAGEKGLGYRETEHVRTAYATSRF